MTDLAAGGGSKNEVADEGGMDYLEKVPRQVITVYLPLSIFLFVLLFPFYWMTVATFKTNIELHQTDGLARPLGAEAHTRKHRTAAVPHRVSALVGKLAHRHYRFDIPLFVLRGMRRLCH